MEIKVFEINDSVREETLEQVDIANIQKIFDKIFNPQNTAHLKIACYANDDSILTRYNNDLSNFNINEFAEELQKAEQKNDRTRNRQITEGYLFVKRDVNHHLSLLKLENIEVIDKDNHYTMKNSFSTETNYYKGCIFSGNLQKITIIDKNKAVAKYWRENFLNLSLIRDEYENSKELISFLKSEKLFSDGIKNQDNFGEIKNETQNYIFDNKYFDKIALTDRLRSRNLIENTNLNEIYSDKSKVLDSEFHISSKAIREVYNKTIQVSKDTKIYTDNYEKLIKRQGLEYRDGKIILSVNDDFIEKLPRELIPND